MNTNNFVGLHHVKVNNNKTTATLSSTKSVDDYICDKVKLFS